MHLLLQRRYLSTFGPAQMAEHRDENRLSRDITRADHIADRSTPNVTDLIRFLHKYSVDKLRSICVDGNEQQCYNVVCADATLVLYYFPNSIWTRRAYLFRFRFRRGNTRGIETSTRSHTEFPRMGRYVCVGHQHSTTGGNRLRDNKTVHDFEVDKIVTVVFETVRYGLTESLHSVL